LTYVLSSAPYSLYRISYGFIEYFTQLSWFHLPLFECANTAIPFILSNFALWTYWVWQGLQRRYANPNATVLTKQNSYWLSGSLMVSVMGFAMQSDGGSHGEDLFEKFAFLLMLVSILSLGLIAALSPHRQTLQDWARYRHQNPQHKRNLLRDLVWGEKSPATVAIALNWASTAIILSAGILLFPFKEYRILALLGALLTAGMGIILASIAQWMLMMKVGKHRIWVAATVNILILLPLVCFAALGYGGVGFFVLPIWALEHLPKTTLLWSLLGQWTTIILLNVAMARQLQQMGRSTTKALEQRDRASRLIAH
jgi:hypothetical protein